MNGQRRAQCAAGIACRRLHPNFIEDTISVYFAGSDAIKRNAACHAQGFHSSLLAYVAGYLDHDLFGDLLKRTGNVHFVLRESFFGIPWRASKKTMKMLVRHGETLA